MAKAIRNINIHISGDGTSEKTMSVSYNCYETTDNRLEFGDSVAVAMDQDLADLYATVLAAVQAKEGI